VPEEERLPRAFDFLQWDGLRELPSHKIGSHLFAAIARKASAGQRRLPSKGMLNDVRVISSYAPFVDAMFVDNECAALLAEEPLAGRLRYKARIFSLNTRDEFLAYVRSIGDSTPDSVKRQALDVYGQFAA
jgi:hypothetical protein